MSTGDSEGPAWNKFWMSMDHGDTESAVSGEGGSHPPQTPDHRSAMSPELHRHQTGLDSVMPGDSASAHGAEMDEASALVGAAEETPFTFKFKSPSGRVHRLAVTASAGLADFVAVVIQKLGNEVAVLGGSPTVEDGKMSHTGFALSYLDNEGDTVSITTDHDLLEAIALARQARKDKVDLFVHDPEKAAIPPTTEAPVQSTAIPPTPPESQVRSRKGYQEDVEELPAIVGRNVAKSSSKSEATEQQQTIPGVPNDLLIPGALVLLGAVIVITFAVGRSSSR